MIPVFLGSEILSEYKSEDGAVHTIERKCKLDVDAPYLLKKVSTFEIFYQSDIYSSKDSIFVELVFNTRQICLYPYRIKYLIDFFTNQSYIYP